MTSETITVLRRGESLPFVFDRSGESIVDWTCEIQVKKFPTDGSNDYAFVPRFITPDTASNDFPGFLTSSEINALTENGLFRLIGLLENTETDEQEQIELRFDLTQSWAA